MQGRVSDAKARQRLHAMQKVVRELAEMKSALHRLDEKRKATKKRIRELEAALQLETLDTAGDSVITAGESGGDVVGKIGGGR